MPPLLEINLRAKKTAVVKPPATAPAGFVPVPLGPTLAVGESYYTAPGGFATIMSTMMIIDQTYFIGHVYTAEGTLLSSSVIYTSAGKYAGRTGVLLFPDGKEHSIRNLVSKKVTPVDELWHHYSNGGSVQYKSDLSGWLLYPAYPNYSMLIFKKHFNQYQMRKAQ